MSLDKGDDSLGSHPLIQFLGTFGSFILSFTHELIEFLLIIFVDSSLLVECQMVFCF